MASDPIMSRSKFNDHAVLAEVDKIRKVAEVPRPAAASGKTAWAMAWMHMVIWNAWKSTYFYADKIPVGDFENYREYATLSIRFLAEHHDAEEKTLFPMLEEKIPGSMDTNHQQHESFLQPLEDVLAYIKTSTEDKFDAAAFRAKLDDFLFPVMEHLADELDSLAADKLSQKMSEDEMQAVNTATHKAQQGDDSKLALPFVVQNLPPGCEFPPAPGFVKNILGPWMFYWKYAGMWKYTAYPWKQTLPAVVPSL
ncbi:hypothetical protein BD626DRAFT_549969 [Schizophyllum amplum]|uniref:Hemerythrin-like domain-containing protein n=1 Tax=Schizophyllum amplum TaxID=97359 RepID=A0A550C5T9_9AGAR|nr:hypothetical protein BD626DRAFT_549969 [Auriculariopsis ampla]